MRDAGGFRPDPAEADDEHRAAPEFEQFAPLAAVGRGPGERPDVPASLALQVERRMEAAGQHERHAERVLRAAGGEDPLGVRDDEVLRIGEPGDREVAFDARRGELHPAEPVAGGEDVRVQHAEDRVGVVRFGRRGLPVSDDDEVHARGDLREFGRAAGPQIGDDDFHGRLPVRRGSIGRGARTQAEHPGRGALRFGRALRRTIGGAARDRQRGEQRIQAARRVRYGFPPIRSW